MDKIIIQNQSLLGGLWGVGWLFAIGFFKLTFWRGVWALFVWPYHFGVWARAKLNN